MTSLPSLSGKEKRELKEFCICCIRLKKCLRATNRQNVRTPRLFIHCRTLDYKIMAKFCSFCVYVAGKNLARCPPKLLRPSSFDRTLDYSETKNSVYISFRSNKRLQQTQAQVDEVI